MDSSVELAACMLEELLDRVMMETESGLSSLSSLGSLTSIPSQQDLPCSQDFQFFFNIAASCPAHSPDEESRPDNSPAEELSLPSSLFYPLPSPASQTDTRSPPSPAVSLSSPLRSPLSPTLPPPSPGVCLMPLTQAGTQPLHYHTQMGYSDSEEESDIEPPAKIFKHKEMRDLTPTSLESSVEVEEEDGSFTEEEDTALPLTFNDSRDLHWKLAKADILRSERALPSQRPASVTLFSDNISSVRKFKTEKKDEDPLGSMVIQKTAAQSPGESRSDKVELGGRIPLPLQSIDTDRAFSRPFSHVKLLNRPPRIGLSKLNRKLSSLHDVSIIQQEE